LRDSFGAPRVTDSADGEGAYVGHTQAKPPEFIAERVEHEIGGPGETTAEDDDLGVEGEHQRLKRMRTVALLGQQALVGRTVVQTPTF
jgi:hypothetical protein